MAKISDMQLEVERIFTIEVPDITTEDYIPPPHHLQVGQDLKLEDHRIVRIVYAFLNSRNERHRYHLALPCIFLLEQIGYVPLYQRHHPLSISLSYQNFIKF